MSRADIATLRGLHRRSEEPPDRDDLVAITTLIVLPQPRVTFRGIEDLAESIRESGLLNRLVVAEYTPAEFREHLALINECWRTEFAFNSFTPNAWSDSEPRYRVLVAGERRYRAIAGHLKDTPLFQEGTPAQIISEQTVLRVLDLQYVENSYDPPTPHEEARALANYYRVRKKRDSALSKAAFGRLVSRSVEVVRNALRFADLPFSIQEYVEKGTIPYSIAVELARLQEEGCNEEELRRWMFQALLARKTVEEFRRQVSSHLEHKRNGQGAFFKLTSEELRNGRRQVVERATIQQHWRMFHYFGRVLALFERGELGQDDSPYSEKSPLHMLRAEIEQMERILPHLDGLMSQQRRKHAAQLIASAKVQTELLLTDRSSKHRS